MDGNPRHGRYSSAMTTPVPPHRARAWLLAVLAVLVATAGVAATVAGWTEGTPAANTQAVLQGLPEPTEITLPEAIAARIDKPTFLVYFSPSCPHCQHAQPELNDVAERLGDTGQILGIASGRSTQSALDRYRDEYAVRYPLILDEGALVARAIGARSTPSILYVEPSPDKKRRKDSVVIAKDAWYPFVRGQGSLLVMRASGQPFGGFDPGRYHGNATCAACHTQETSSWVLSHHSIAWDTLQAGGHEGQSECVGCHVTGHESGGWVADQAGTDHLRDVGCEACHGPGGPHDGVPTEAKATCEGCHDAKHSIAFSVDKGLPHIDHYAANAMSEEERTAAFKALITGERDRPLLAFDAGPHVGSETCATCHEGEHAWWSADAHGKAMATLDGKVHEGKPAAEQVACVRCHASPKTHGAPAPTELSGFAVDEGGVGCESCHGPGGAHVAAGGGKDNIEGLGEDCPVCVLEALCTSCHTREWDPSWDLHKRLSDVAHTREYRRR